MKGYIKVIIAGAVIIGIGLAVFLIALGLNGWTVTPEFEMKEFTSTKVNTSLSVDLDAGLLKIDYHDGDEIKVTYPSAKGYDSRFSEEDGKLSIVSNKRRWYTFSWGVNFPETVVLIPRNQIKNVDIYVNAGGVQLAGGEFENVNVKVNAGACEVGKITGLKLLKIKLNAGAVNVDGVRGDKLICNVNAGRATVKNVDCTTTEVGINAGLAELNFAGVRADYSSSVNVSAGSCNGLYDNVSDTGKSIKVKVSAGTVNVSFLN